MKTDKLIDAIGMIDDRFVEEAHEKTKKQRFSFTPSWSLFGKLAAAACALLLIINIFPVFFHSYNGGSYYASDAKESYDYSPSYMAAPGAGNYVSDEEAYYQYAAEEAGGAPMEAEAKADVKQNKKLILTSYMTLETQTLDQLITDINSLLSKYGAYMQRSSLSNRTSTSRSYEAVIRIPAQNYAAFLEEIKGEGNALYYSEETKDVTDSYTDIEARLNSLKAQEAKVLEFYDKAQSLEDLMSVESRLSDIRYEIEYYEAQIKNYDLLISYSTLNLTVNETKVYTPVSPSFFERLSRSFKAGWNSFIDGIGDLIIDIAYNIWSILLLAVLVLVGIFIYRKFRNRKKA